MSVKYRHMAVPSWGKLVISPPARPCYVEGSCVVMLHSGGRKSSYDLEDLEDFTEQRGKPLLHKILPIPWRKGEYSPVYEGVTST
jgi:hypothetical protein